MRNVSNLASFVLTDSDPVGARPSRPSFIRESLQKSRRIQEDLALVLRRARCGALGGGRGHLEAAAE
jgi:hypothetical protein